jgi:hypothetical protein
MSIHDRLVLANSGPVTRAFDLFQLPLLLKRSPFARRCAVESLDSAKNLANGGQGLLLAFSLLTGHPEMKFLPGSAVFSESAFEYLVHHEFVRMNAPIIDVDIL